jgi:hypothetical protein
VISEYDSAFLKFVSFCHVPLASLTPPPSPIQANALRQQIALAEKETSLHESDIKKFRAEVNKLRPKLQLELDENARLLEKVGVNNVGDFCNKSCHHDFIVYCVRL